MPRRVVWRFYGTHCRPVGQGTETLRYGPPVGKQSKADHLDNPARTGFARSCGCTPDQLEIAHDGKMERWSCRVRTPAVSVHVLLPEIITKAVAATPCPRGMVWGDGRHFFARPVRWVVALFGSEVVPVELFGHRAGCRTHGHRVHAPDPIVLQPTDRL